MSPTFVWNDSGLGGKQGSLWSAAFDADGGTGLLAPTSGHQPPTDLLKMHAREWAVEGSPQVVSGSL